MIEAIVSRYIRELDAELKQIVEASLVNDEPQFGDMIRYAMGWIDEHGEVYAEPTGKRLRPTLLLLVTECAGGTITAGLPAAAAIELIHNFSLIHDDIQDNSPIRHTRPTVWKIWGVANAINAGDALFTIAYSGLHKLVKSVPADRILYIWDIFNRTNIELTRGQHLDMRFEKISEVSTSDYISMISGKSAALLAACAEIGAYIASGDQDLSDHYRQFGLNLGIAFQIRDDILGIWGDPAVTGKSAATDIIARKKSLPVLFGLSQSAALQEIYNQDSQITEQQVQVAVTELDRIGARDYTRQQELAYYDSAMKALSRAQPQGEAAELLHQLVDALFQRSY